MENFAEAAVEGENLGGRGVTDLLTISFSSNDYVGHRVGPMRPPWKICRFAPITYSTVSSTS